MLKASCAYTRSCFKIEFKKKFYIILKAIAFLWHVYIWIICIENEFQRSAVDLFLRLYIMRLLSPIIRVASSVTIEEVYE